MPTKAPRKPAARRVYETIDRPKQTYFTPQHRTVLDRNPSLSAPTRQQTLTQIDFVCRLPDEDVDIDYDYLPEEIPQLKKRRRVVSASAGQDQDATYEDPVPKKKKRRKTAPAAVEESNNVYDLTDQPCPVRPKRKIVSKTIPSTKVKKTLSKGIAKKTTKKSSKSLQDNPDEALKIYEELPNSPQAQSRRSSEIMMPSPRTPRTVVKTEIPSSQSPGDTPLSMRSRRSARNDSRSPLKEKSNNRRIAKPSKTDGGKSVRWTPRLEVRDTFEGEQLSPVKKRTVPRVPKLVIRDTFEPGSEGSELSTITQSSKSETISQKKLPSHKSDIPLSNMPSASILLDSIHPRPSPTREPFTPTLETMQLDQPIQSDIQDIDDEHRRAPHGEDDFDIGLDTQSALHDAQTLRPDAKHTHERIPSIVEDFNTAMRAAAQGLGVAPLHTTNTKSTPFYDTNTEHRPRTIPSTPPPPTPRSKRQANSPPPATTQVPRTPPPRLSDSEQASAQLVADVLRQTQRLSAPLVSNAAMTKNNLRPSSPPILIEDDDDLPPVQAHTHTHTGTTPLSLPLPVPFSQATTTDTTQSSPRPSVTEVYTQVPSSPQPPPLPHPRRSLLDKHPRAAVVSSSPLQALLQASDAELSSPSQRVWDGMPLTDSQLLPDSLMDMAVPRPPWEGGLEGWE